MSGNKHRKPLFVNSMADLQKYRSSGSARGSARDQLGISSGSARGFESA